MPARPPIAFRRHDHAACRDGALAEARQCCKTRGARLTPTRQRVLELLLESHSAVGAYDVLSRLKAEGLGAQPPIAYRALEFLVSHGFAHRIEKLNAYVACAHPGDAHAPAFMICRDCGMVAEMPEDTVTDTLAAIAENMGFALEHAVVEAVGLCPGCKRDAA
jgi:Fur family zinc uptake transcriptional regulator